MSGTCSAGNFLSVPFSLAIGPGPMAANGPVQSLQPPGL